MKILIIVGLLLSATASNANERTDLFKKWDNYISILSYENREAAELEFSSKEDILDFRYGQQKTRNILNFYVNELKGLDVNERKFSIPNIYTNRKKVVSNKIASMLVRISASETDFLKNVKVLNLKTNE